MLILHVFDELGYTAYIGSHDDKYIFNIIPTNEPKPTGGYRDLKFLCKIKGLRLPEVNILVRKAEEIMGKTIKENLDISK